MPPPAGKLRTAYKPGAISDDPEQLDGLPKDMVGYGSMGVGKTRLAATWSKQWPEVVPPGSTTYLNDVAWVRCDKGAIDSLIALKVRPKYSIDLLKLLTPVRPGEADRPVARDILEASDWVLQELQFYAEEYGVKKVIWDTATAYMDFVSGYWLGEACPSSTSGRRDTQAAWGRIGETFFRMWETQTLLGYRILWLAHPKQNQSEMSLTSSKAKFEDKVKATISSTPGDNYIVPAIVGKSQQLIVGHSSLVLWLKASNVGKGNNYERYICPYGSDGARGKNRYHDILSDKEEPNLLKLEEKIQKAIDDK